MKNNIYLDIGNTNTKWKFKGSYFTTLTEKFDFGDLPVSSTVWASCVSQRSFGAKSSHINFVDSQREYKSLVNSYQIPSSLGADRWLAMIALYEINSNGSFILIDIGTAVTIDAVNNSGIHLGGLIFPGLDKIRKSFDIFPVSLNKNIFSVGQSTEDAWTIGTLNLALNTINQKVKELSVELPDASIFLTGGGYKDIKDFLEFDHSYHEYLVLDGLEIYANNMG